MLSLVCLIFATEISQEILDLYDMIFYADTFLNFEWYKSLVLYNMQPKKNTIDTSELNKE